MTGLKGYDAWKLASPDDEPGKTYSCDCCGKSVLNVEQCWAPGGLETWACVECRGDAGEHEDDECCPGCGAVEGTPEWGTVGDGFDGYCPSCADKREEEGVYE